MKAEFLILRLIHILGGIFWVGSMVFTTFFLAPVIRSSPAMAGQVMAGLQKRRLFVALPVVAQAEPARFKEMLELHDRWNTRMRPPRWQDHRWNGDWVEEKKKRKG